MSIFTNKQKSAVSPQDRRSDPQIACSDEPVVSLYTHLLRQTKKPPSLQLFWRKFRMYEGGILCALQSAERPRRWRHIVRARAPQVDLILSSPAPTNRWLLFMPTFSAKQKTAFGGFVWRRRWDSNPRYLAVSLVFKTSSLNHSDTSPCCSRSLL